LSIAVRGRALASGFFPHVGRKFTLAEELRAFLARLPKGRATQDESVRMVVMFERFVHGDESVVADAAEQQPQQQSRAEAAPQRANASSTLSVRRSSRKARGGGAGATATQLSRAAPREDGGGTWISTEMQDAYRHLHRLGHAHSVETWVHL
jgi:hypothetical protein